MQVFLTPVVDRYRWRIEIRPDGRVTVWKMVGQFVASAPQPHPTDMRTLGGWLVEQGIDPDDLVPA